MTNLGKNVFLENDNNSFFDNSAATGTEDILMDSLLATGWGTAFLDIDTLYMERKILLLSSFSSVSFLDPLLMVLSFVINHLHQPITTTP